MNPDIFFDLKPQVAPTKIEDLPDGAFLHIPALPLVQIGKGRKTYKAAAMLKRNPESDIETVEVAFSQIGYDSFATNPYQMKTSVNDEMVLVPLVSK